MTRKLWRSAGASRSLVATALILGSLLLGLSGCGYHAVGGASARLPADLHTIAIPAFQNQTNAYRLEQVLTEAVVREFLARTQYRVISSEDESADAVLRGTVVSAQVAPVTFDSQTGRASTALVTVSLKVTLADRHGKVLYDNPTYIFREQYQLSADPATFFQEETPAVRRMALDFARTLVGNVLEAY
jgi:outer membrane lipopolysaccharide assembly protein LptE/RlpB